MDRSWEKIKFRKESDNVIAGDDEPYYRYKREKFLGLLNEIEFTNKKVLEIGCGPGGNLLEIHSHKPNKLVGVDISNQMVELAKNKICTMLTLLKLMVLICLFQIKLSI